MSKSKTNMASHMVDYIKYQRTGLVWINWIHIVAIIQVILVTMGTTVQAFAQHTEEICLTEVFTARCPGTQIVVIDSAYYGRMDVGKCVTFDMGYVGCAKNVISIADRMCSGKTSCTIPVPHTDLEATAPCITELKSYLKIVYHCQPVLLPDENNKNACDNTYNNASMTRGNISNHVMVENNKCGVADHPWIISAKSGQTINLTLIDFSVGDNFFEYPIMDGDSNVEICQPYGFIKDSADDDIRSICGGQRRVSHLYNSLANQVEIHFNPEYKSKNFIISFEVVGCPDEVPPAGVWYRRLSHDRASMGCKSVHAELTWYLHCEGHAWVGSRGNCSSPLAAGRGNGQRKESGIHIGLAIAIIAGAALGVGFVIVCVGIIRYRRRENPELATNYSTQTMLIRQSRPPDEYEMRCTCPVPPQGQQQKVTQTLHRPQRTPAETRHATLHRSPQVPRHYSLNHTVQVNGNDYEHIWQTPLPIPRRTSTEKSPPSSPQSGDTTGGGEGVGVGGTDGEYTKYNTDTTNEEDRDRPYYIRSKDIYNGSKDDPAKDSLLSSSPTNMTTVGGYSTLRKTNKDKTKQQQKQQHQQKQQQTVIANKPAEV